jgi:DNA-binding transcriptional regulator GbsR (MarR family)
MWPAMTTPMDRFIEHLGLFMQVEGMPRIAGQILGYLIVEGEPRTLAQMTEALQISKASASTNARLLEFKGSIRRVSPVGQRQDAYQVVDEPDLQMMLSMAERFRASAETMAALGAEFPPSHDAARARVERMAEIYQKTAGFIEQWSHELAGEFAAGAEKEKEPSHEQG